MGGLQALFNQHIQTLYWIQNYIFVPSAPQFEYMHLHGTFLSKTDSTCLKGRESKCQDEGQCFLSLPSATQGFGHLSFVFP